MSEDIRLYISLAGLLISICGLLWQHFKTIAGINERLSTMETKIDLFWKAVEKHVVDLLKAPHTKRYDVLLDKLVQGTLTNEEARELKGYLTNHLKTAKASKRLAMVLLLARIETGGVRP